jgi:hypothetical protein
MPQKQKSHGISAALQTFRLSYLQLGEYPTGPEFNATGNLGKSLLYLWIYTNHVWTIKQGHFPSQANKDNYVFIVLTNEKRLF